METDKIVYYSEENGVNVLLSLDSSDEDDDISCFYNEEAEEKYRSYFDYDDENE